VTISIGVAGLTAGDDPAGLIRRADEALYASKARGRNRVSWHDGRQVHDRKPPEPPVPPEPKIVEAKPPTAESGVSPGGHAGRVAAEPPAAQGGVSPDGHAGPAAAEPPARKTTGQDRDLGDRATFCALLQRRLCEYRQAGQPLSLVLLRVDGFSEILAAYGQPASCLATRITMQFLSASFHGMDVAGQLQPDTFAVLLPGTRTAQAVALGERLRLAIARCKFPLAGQPFQFTVSVAGAEANRCDDPQRLLARLEETLDAATAAGGNCTFVHAGRSPEPADPGAIAAPAASACGTAG